jgi:hypothetical protein
MTPLAVPSVKRVSLPQWLPLAAVGLFALVMLRILPTNLDVSWGLTMAEKWLDGARLYIDLIEVNPPATVFLYVMPVVIARHTGLSPEVTANGLIFLGVAVSLGVTGRILSAAKLVPSERVWPLVTIAAALLLILPAQNFGEREHIAVIAILPFLAVSWLRSVRLAPSLQGTLTAGIGAGITAIIKPYFAVAVLFAGVAAALSARSWRVLFALENWIAAAMLAAYVLFVWCIYPVYFAEMMPLLSDVYVPVKEPLAILLVHVGIPLWAITLVILWRRARHEMLRPPLLALLAASAGFAVAYVVQQKGWPYHSYPFLALALLALGSALVATPAQAVLRDRLMGFLTWLWISGLSLYWMSLGGGDPALADSIRAVAPHAKVLSISSQLGSGHPAVRAAGGVWVGRVPSLWVTKGVFMLRARGGLDPAWASRLETYTERDRTMLIEDIAKERPDVILVERAPDTDWLAWALADPTLAAELANYRLDSTIGTVGILIRLGPKSEPPHTRLAPP